MLIFRPQDFDSSFCLSSFCWKVNHNTGGRDPENTDLHESQRLPFLHQDLAPPNSQHWDVSGQTTSRIGTQTQPTEDRVPKATLTSQLPINAPCDTTLPACGTRPSFTHQWEGASPSSQEIATSPMTSLTHWKADTRRKRSYDLLASRKESTNTEN